LSIDAFIITAIEFLDANPELMPTDNAVNFISDDNGATYNQCHCTCFLQTLSSLADSCIVWSNFEIGDLELWRSETYSRFFDFLDKKGGFYYEV